jgi:hypothetical protein
MKKALRHLPADLFPDEPATKPRASTRFLEWAGAKVDEETGKVTAKEKRAKPKTMAAAVFNRARVETQAMMDSCDWEGCTARHILALYDLMHVKTYGIEASMSATERHQLVLRAGGFVRREFGVVIDCCEMRQASRSVAETLTCSSCGEHVATKGNFVDAVDYFCWLWTREIGREKWRREHPERGGGRLTMGICMAGTVITDYRLALTRKTLR